MKLYIARHAETEFNAAGLIAGHINTPLTPKGLIQAKDFAEYLSWEYQEKKFDEIHCADQDRHEQTAEPISDMLRIPIIKDSRLRERNFGSLEGKSWNDFPDDLRIADSDQQYDYRPYGGESVNDVRDRIFEYLADMKDLYKEKKILTLSSGGIIRFCYSEFLKTIPGHIKNGSLHVFDIDNV